MFAILVSVLAGLFLSSANAEALELSMFLIGIFCGFFSFSALQIFRSLENNAERIGIETGHRWIFRFAVLTSPVGAVPLAIMLRFTTSREIMVGATVGYLFGSVMIWFLLDSFEVVLKKTIEQEKDG